MAWIFENKYPEHICAIISVICVKFEKNLSLDLARQIAVALISSKLDYCNSRFYIIPENDIAGLQRVQNCLARVVTKAPRLSRSTPIPKRLHSLPVKFHIYFKICTITFRTLKDNQTAYLADLNYLFVRNAKSIYAPQIQIDLLLI